MPVEIRELHINVSISSPPGNQDSAGTASAGGSGGSDSRGNDRAAIVAECVEKVMEILQYKKER